MEPPALAVRRLPRGGHHLQTPFCALQVGAPPETLKDTVAAREAVPHVVLLPDDLADASRGLATCDVEFLVYWNLFVRRRPLVVVGTEQQAKAIRAALQESLLGPVKQDATLDVAPGHPVPDLQREAAYFRRGPYRQNDTLELDDAIAFAVLAGGCADVDVDGHRLRILREGDDYVVDVEGQQARLPAQVDLPTPTRRTRSPSTSSFVPPRFGVTVLGRSHGFDPDPHERTTGFVLWIDGHGTLVDPPLNTADLLDDDGIDEAFIDGLILTHVHADHDAGCWEWLTRHPETRLLTTTTIFHSWVRKWSALVEVDADSFAKRFAFEPVRVGVALRLPLPAGAAAATSGVGPIDAPVGPHSEAVLLFRFNLHSIPTLGFEAHKDGASFFYSGDTLFDAAVIEHMTQLGHLDEVRRNELLHIDGRHDLLFHESGVAPLHTPLAALEALPASITRKLRVLHTTPARLSTSKLLIAQPGAAHTIVLGDGDDEGQARRRLLQTLQKTALLGGVDPATLEAVLDVGRRLVLAPGAPLIRAGDNDDVLYVVTGGKARLTTGTGLTRTCGVTDVLGETGVWLQQPRNADVVALTLLSLLVVDGADARRVLAHTDVDTRVKNQALVRELDIWPLVDAVPALRRLPRLTKRQRSRLELDLHPVRVDDGAAVTLDAGAVWLLVRGCLESVSDAAPLVRGAFVDAAQPLGCRARGAALLLRLDRPAAAPLMARQAAAPGPESVLRGLAEMVTEHLPGSQR